MEFLSIEGDGPVRARRSCYISGSYESRSLGLEHKQGGSFHLKLINFAEPIVKKYREGKLKRPSKGELKETETVGWEANTMVKARRLFITLIFIET